MRSLERRRRRLRTRPGPQTTQRQRTERIQATRRRLRPPLRARRRCPGTSTRGAWWARRRGGSEGSGGQARVASGRESRRCGSAGWRGDGCWAVQCSGSAGWLAGWLSVSSWSSPPCAISMRARFERAQSHRSCNLVHSARGRQSMRRRIRSQQKIKHGQTGAPNQKLTFPCFD